MSSPKVKAGLMPDRPEELAEKCRIMCGHLKVTADARIKCALVPGHPSESTGCVFKYNSVKCDILMRENFRSEGHGRVYKFFKVLYVYVLNVIVCSEEIKVCPIKKKKSNTYENLSP